MPVKLFWIKIFAMNCPAFYVFLNFIFLCTYLSSLNVLVQLYLIFYSIYKCVMFLYVSFAICMTSSQEPHFRNYV
jgi:hypothetical protein